MLGRHFNYYFGKLSAVNYDIAIHPGSANRRLAAYADKILVISPSIIPDEYRQQFVGLTQLIDKSYERAERSGTGLHPYKLIGIYDKTAVKYIKLLWSIQFAMETLEESQAVDR